jgi:hypothetical protein
MVSLPYDWDIREHYSDTLYTIVAANFMSIPIPLEERMSFSVSGYVTDKDPGSYYLDEIRQLKRDRTVALEETGSTIIADLLCYWIKFTQKVDDHEAYNLVVYVKKPENKEVYILQSIVYSSEKHDLMLCYMKQLINSFEIVDDN